MLIEILKKTDIESYKSLIDECFDGSNNIVPFVFENIDSNARIKNTKQVPLAEQYYINGFYLTNQ